MAATPQQQAVETGSKTIAEDVTDTYKLILETDNSRLECRASIEIYNVDETITPAELIDRLATQKITDSVDLEQVAIFCSGADRGEELTNVLLARGQEPVNGQDGWLELVVNTGSDEPNLNEDEQGRVDFKSIQTFSSVEADDVIANIYPPTSGQPGKSITGEPIPAFDGQPCQVKAGNAVRISEDGTQALAEQSGRPFFERNLLSIAEEFVVNGDVDLSVGHISFKGFVNVKGDVLDDFNITATKGVSISGAVGASRIKCEGPVSIGTMAGLGRGKITCKGGFKARYLNQTTIECLGHVQVSYEIRNSTVKATGSILSPNGLITGGQMVALEGIEAKVVGSRSGAPSLLTCGVYFPEEDRLHYLRNRQKSLAGQLNRVEESLKAQGKKRLDKLRPALREALEMRIDILTQRQSGLSGEKEAVRAELNQFKLAEHTTANPKINVLKTIRERVTLSLGETRMQVPPDISGPVSIIEDPRKGGFRYLSYSKLAVSAENLEAEALTKEFRKTTD